MLKRFEAKVVPNVHHCPLSVKYVQLTARNPHRVTSGEGRPHYQKSKAQEASTGEETLLKVCYDKFCAIIAHLVKQPPVPNTWALFLLMIE